ncbi:MAG: mannose-1-phosphate guanylyltransferase [Candidatus Bruticola sp.]
MSENVISCLPKLAAVIMAGGAGTRFWPVSTSARPKQFLNLFGGRTLLQQSFDRLKGIVPLERILVLTSKKFVNLVKKQLPELSKEQIIGEPCRRDTAAAVALASLLVQKLFGDCTMLVLTSDHYIEPTDKFQRVILSAAAGSKHSKAIYTLGIKPTYAATAYGYLECGLQIDDPADSPAFDELLTPSAPKHFQLLRFKEKPQEPQAQAFFESGHFFWNSGMFVWETETILSEFSRQLPKHLENLKPAIKVYGTPYWEQALASAFEKLRKISVDYAIMERAREIRIVEADFNWLDLGDWMAVAPFFEHDEDLNRYQGNISVYRSHNNIIFTDNPKSHIALVGVDNMAVIQSANNLLVVPLDQLGNVKKLVETLPESLA